jgi:hypothetical protein
VNAVAEVAGALCDDTAPKVRTVDALIALSFRWLGLGPDLRKAPQPEDPKVPKAVRDARRLCGKELFELIGRIAVDPSADAKAENQARADRDHRLRLLVECGITEAREASDKFGHLVELLKRVAEGGTGHESLLAIAVETAENWRDRTDAVRESMQSDLATITEARP